MSTIVDLSPWQGTISPVTFQQWKAADVTAIIHKIGGGDSGIYKDSHHDQNVRNARAVGLTAHRYYFNGGDPAAAAAMIAQWLTGDLGLQGDEKFFWDIESPAWSDSEEHAATLALRGRGVPVFGHYGSASTLDSYPQAHADGLALWVASYGSNSGRPEGTPYLGPWSSYWAWQYTSNGSLPGYPGRVDLSVTGTAQNHAATPAAVTEEQDMNYIAIQGKPGVRRGGTYAIFSDGKGGYSAVFLGAGVGPDLKPITDDNAIAALQKRISGLQ